MKKCISVLVLFALITAGAFAQVSLGGGIMFDYSANNGYVKDEVFNGSNYTDFGGYVFLDLNMVELDVSLAGGVIKFEGNGASIEDGKQFSIGISLLGKLPIELGAITLFPILGLNYNMVASMEAGSFSTADTVDFNQFSLLAGAGLDFNISSSLYLRAEALFRLAFPSKASLDAADAISGAKAALGVGPRVNVALGFKLF